MHSLISPTAMHSMKSIMAIEILNIQAYIVEFVVEQAGLSLF